MSGIFHMEYNVSLANTFSYRQFVPIFFPNALKGELSAFNLETKGVVG